MNGARPYRGLNITARTENATCRVLGSSEKEGKSPRKESEANERRGA